MELIPLTICHMGLFPDDTNQDKQNLKEKKNSLMNSILHPLSLVLRWFTNWGVAGFLIMTGEPEVLLQKALKQKV